MKSKKRLSDIALPISQKPAWKEKSDWIHDNKEWLTDAAVIAVKILQTLDQKEMTQRQLAKRLDISPQAVNKIIKGRQNLTLGTIRKIERALDVSLISIKRPEAQRIRATMTKMTIVYTAEHRSYEDSITKLTGSESTKTSGSVIELSQSA